MEFKYFETSSGEKIISCDFIVGEDEIIRKKVQSASLPEVDEKQFLSSLDKNGLEVFQQIFDFAKQNDLMVRWGSKGFSLKVKFDTGFVRLFSGYPPTSVFKQSIYIGFEEITKKVINPHDIVKLYKKRIENLGYFINAKSKLKWVINKSYSKDEIKSFIEVVAEVISKIKERGLI